MWCKEKEVHFVTRSRNISTYIKKITWTLFNKDVKYASWICSISGAHIKSHMIHQQQQYKLARTHTHTHMFILVDRLRLLTIFLHHFHSSATMLNEQSTASENWFGRFMHCTLCIEQLQEMTTTMCNPQCELSPSSTINSSAPSNSLFYPKINAKTQIEFLQRTDKSQMALLSKCVKYNKIKKKKSATATRRWHALITMPNNGMVI